MAHHDRLRQDYPERARCEQMRADVIADRGYDPHESADRCALPDDCPRCHRYVCNRCERVVPWEDGGDGDGGALCSDCWCIIVAPWQDAEDELLAERA